MFFYDPVPVRFCDDPEALCRQVLDHHLALAAAGRHRVTVPELLGLMRQGEGRHYHFTPESFLQISGRDDFDFPCQRFSLIADDICVMPVGVPHRERMRARRGPFRQIVFMFTSAAVAWHLKEGATDDGVPRIVHPTRVVPTPSAGRAIDRLSEICTATRERSPASAQLIQGALLSYLALLRDLVEQGASARQTESHRVMLCRHEVMRHLSDPALSVHGLARTLGCSPNYLSHRFHRETGTPLVRYIERERMRQAMALLDATALSVKEVCVHVGHPEPSYFARVFRRLEGLSPRQYRNRPRS